MGILVKMKFKRMEREKKPSKTNNGEAKKEKEDGGLWQKGRGASVPLSEPQEEDYSRLSRQG